MEPVHGAPAAMPVARTELERIGSSNQYSNQYNVNNATVRLSRPRKNPWADIGRAQRNLSKFE